MEGERLVPQCGSQHHFVDSFTFETISLELFVFGRECSECLLVEDLACDQITPAWYGRLGDDTTVSCEGKIQVGTSLLPLVCWQGPEDRNKGVPAEIQKPEAVTSKRADSTTLDLEISLNCHCTKLSSSSTKQQLLMTHHN